MQRNSCISVLAGVVCALFSFGACAYSTNFQPHIEGDSNRESDRPELNSAPHHLLFLRGEKDPSIEVWLGVQFATTNEQCQSRSQFQSQINALFRDQSVGNLVRVPSGQTNYSVQFLLDQYLPGRCGWRPVGIVHTEFVPDSNTGSIALSGVTTIRDDGVSELAIEWICQQKSYSLKGSGPLPLHLSCMSHNKIGKPDPPISTDGAVIDMNFQLAPGVGH